MKETLNRYKIMISESIKKFLNEKEDEFSKINEWGLDFKKRFSPFSLSGKMLRGSLVILSYTMFKNSITGEIVKTGSAAEIFHSSLLIHDDIMDRDKLRRGKKTIFYQYKELGENNRIGDSYHFGESMGICAGDIGFFFSFEIISGLKIDKRTKEKLLKIWSKEFEHVCLAQMQDIWFGSSDKEVSEDDILDLYKNKTARYTFSLPLMAGAILAHQDDRTIRSLEKLGECLGIIFQIKDDELGLFGNEEKIGKSIGSDIKEGKKTLLYIYMLKNALEDDKKKLNDIFGNKDLSNSMVDKVRSIVERYNIKQLINKKIMMLGKKAEEVMQTLDIKDSHKKLLSDLLNYNINRKS